MAKIKLKIGAGKATMSPPIGPILGQYGIPGPAFCQKLNKQVSHIKLATPLRVVFIKSNQSVIPDLIPFSLDWNALLRSCFIYSDNSKRTISIFRIYQLAIIAAFFYQQEHNPLWIQQRCRLFLHQVKSMQCHILLTF